MKGTKIGILGEGVIVEFQHTFFSFRLCVSKTGSGSHSNNCNALHMEFPGQFSVELVLFTDQESTNSNKDISLQTGLVD